MSSRDGFSRADIDTGFYHDPKVLALARRLRDDALTMAYAGLYQATVLASWNAGRRVTLAEAAPAWWLSDLDSPLAELQAVSLLDADGLVLEHAFAAWAGRLIDAREAAAAAGREGARRRWHPDEPPEAETEASPVDQASPPDRGAMGSPMHQPASRPDGLPTSRSGRPGPHARTRDGGADVDPSPAPRSTDGRPPCFLDDELFRLHQTQHYVTGPGIDRCHTCDAQATALVGAVQ